MHTRPQLARAVRASLKTISPQTRAAVYARRRLQVFVRELEKHFPIQRRDCVRAVVFEERKRARRDRCVERRHFGRAQIRLPEQSVDRAGGHRPEKFAVRIGPQVAAAGGDEHRARRRERNQKMRVDRHVVPVAGIFLEIAGELVAVVGGHVVDGLAEVAARERRAHLATLAGKDQRETPVLRAGPQHRLAQARMPDERDALRVHRAIRFEVVEHAARAPRPRADRAPLVRRGLRAIGRECQPDDAGGVTRGVVRLDLGIAQRGVAVAVRKDVGHRAGVVERSSRRRCRRGCGCGRNGRRGTGRIAEKQVQQHGHGPGGLVGQIEHDVHPRPVRAVAENSHEVPAHRRALERVRVGLGHGPRHLGGVRGHAPVDLGLVKFQNLRAARREPSVGVAHGLAVLPHERVGQCVGRHLGLVVICEVPGRRALQRVARGVLELRHGRGLRRVRRESGEGQAPHERTARSGKISGHGGATRRRGADAAGPLNRTPARSYHT